MRAALAGLAFCAVASAARAETVLHLSETATISIRPDRLTAAVRADAATDSAAAAQDRVNAAIADALAEAGKADGIAASTDQYNVWRIEPKPGETAEWRASQTLILRGQDGPSVLKLVGALQKKGMAVERLGWELAPETARSAERTATLQAVKALRARADEVAGAVGLQFDSYRSLTVGSAPPMPIRLRTMAVSAAALDPPVEPTAAAEDMHVSSTVEADIALKPR